MSTMALWFSRMIVALPRSRRMLGGYTGSKHLVITHGDTFTTWFGALMGRLTRHEVMHVESGLRSFDLRRPFPEEINRLITFGLRTTTPARTRMRFTICATTGEEARDHGQHPDRHTAFRSRSYR